MVLLLSYFQHLTETGIYHKQKGKAAKVQNNIVVYFPWDHLQTLATLVIRYGRLTPRQLDELVQN